MVEVPAGVFPSTVTTVAAIVVDVSVVAARTGIAVRPNEPPVLTTTVTTGVTPRPCVTVMVLEINEPPGQVIVPVPTVTFHARCAAA